MGYSQEMSRGVDASVMWYVLYLNRSVTKSPSLKGVI